MRKTADPAPAYDAEIRELLVGTWLAIALVADSLAETGELDQDALYSRLIDAEATTRNIDRRHTSIRAVRQMLDMFDMARSEVTVPDDLASGTRGFEIEGRRAGTSDAKKRWPSASARGLRSPSGTS